MSEPLDLEMLSKSGQHPAPHTKHFRIRVDLQTYVVDRPKVTGAEILTLAGKVPPEDFHLRQHFHGQKTRTVGLHEVIDLCEPGVERFTTLPRKQTDGEARRQVTLSKDDVAALNELDLPWETLQEATGQWVILRDCPVPAGFIQASVAIAVRLEAGYPRTALDMAYFDPPLQLTSGREIPATQAQQVIDGKSWQRWSRHYTPENPWRIGIDTVATHLVLARGWLEQEVLR